MGNAPPLFLLSQRPKIAKTNVERETGQASNGHIMRLLSYAYRFLTNFALLVLVYFSLNYIDKYHNRAMLAMLILVYSALRAASAIRTFYFFQRIEKLESEARRLITLITEGGAQSPLKKQTVQDVTFMR